MKKIFIFVIPLLFAGCIVPYKSYRCKIIAHETVTAKPAEKYPVRVNYPYDHYGVFYILNAPKTIEMELDDQGQVEIEISNFYKPNIIIGSTIFFLEEDIIKNGGKPEKSKYFKNDEKYQKFREHNTDFPQKGYPEVDIIIVREKTGDSP